MTAFFPIFKAFLTRQLAFECFISICARSRTSPINSERERMPFCLAPVPRDALKRRGEGGLGEKQRRREGGHRLEWKNTRKPASIPMTDPNWRPPAKGCAKIIHVPNIHTSVCFCCYNWLPAATYIRLKTLLASPAQWKQRHVLAVCIWASLSHRILTHAIQRLQKLAYQHNDTL